MYPMYPTPGPPPPPPQGWPVGGPAPMNDTKAIVALVLGILSVLVGFCYIGWLIGIPAIVFGVLAHRDIKRSNGIMVGGGMATAGIVLGSIGTVIGFAVIGVVVVGLLVAKPVAPAPVVPPALGPTPAATAPTVTAPPGGWGSVHVIVLHAAGGDLRKQLADEVSSSKASGETVLVQTSQASCVPCAEVLRAVPDPVMQAALDDVELVIVDVDELGPQLRSLGMARPDVPWFYLVDSRGEPRDGISADEWGDNVATSIAPVLGAFVHGTLTKRKHAWKGI
jgi:hypothetical protein